MNAAPIRKHAVSKPRGTSENITPVFQPTALKAALHRTIHEADKSVEQLAFECRVSPSYLYRACLEGESGCRFPLDLALPLMRATGDYRLLDYLVSECDRATVKLPRVRRLKRKDPQVINEIAGNFNGAMSGVLEFFARPDRQKRTAIQQALHGHLCEVISLMKAVADFHQGELF